jgi:hypothetical protein
MVNVFDVNAKGFELTDKLFDFYFVRVTPHVPNLTIFPSAKNEVNNPGYSIGYGDFCLVP